MAFLVFQNALDDPTPLHLGLLARNFCIQLLSAVELRGPAACAALPRNYHITFVSRGLDLGLATLRRLGDPLDHVPLLVHYLVSHGT